MKQEIKTGSVLVAMSGGVDSSVAAAILREQGYTVIGATMKLWDYEDVGWGGGSAKRSGCCNLEAINDARAVCQSLEMPHYVINFTDHFKSIVIENFVSEYARGFTPNPCVICNTKIKWESLLEKGLELGCDYIATGHYARLNYNDGNGRYEIIRGVDDTRDQSYALWGISQEALARTILPLGALTKKETRQWAQKAGLKTADVEESMEICFVADDNYERFIREWSKDPIPGGDIVDDRGEVIGRHKGIPFYTIGQRKGLGISHPTPLYVNNINIEKNQIVVGDNQSLEKDEMTVSRVNWVSIPPGIDAFEADVQIRYRHRAQAAKITPLDTNRLSVKFDKPQRAITPGQSAVLYSRNTVLAGGIIDE